MEPVVWTKAIERDMRALAARSLDVVDAACEDAMALASGERAVERAASDARALAWAFAECARGCVTSDAFGKRMRGFGFDDAKAETLTRRYAEEALRGERGAATRRGTATNRSDAYDGLEWRLDANVSSRASLVESEAKYLLKLGLARGDDGGTKKTTLAETDYQTLKALKDACESALAASTGAHATRLARYVRRPKT